MSIKHLFRCSVAVGTSSHFLYVTQEAVVVEVWDFNKPEFEPLTQVLSDTLDVAYVAALPSFTNAYPLGLVRKGIYDTIYTLEQSLYQEGLSEFQLTSIQSDIDRLKEVYSEMTPPLPE